MMGLDWFLDRLTSWISLYVKLMDCVFQKAWILNKKKLLK